MENANSSDYLTKIKNTVIDNIRRTGKPSVEAFTNIPGGSLLRGMESEDEDEEDDLDADENPDKRLTQRQRDAMIVAENEFDDQSEDEEYKASLGVRQQPGQARRRGIMSYQNADAVEDDEGGSTLGAVRGLNGESARSTNQASPALGDASVSVSRASSRQPANGTGTGTATPRTRTPTVQPEGPDDNGDGDVEMENADAPQDEQKNDADNDNDKDEEMDIESQSGDESETESEIQRERALQRWKEEQAKAARQEEGEDEGERAGAAMEDS